MKKSHIILYSIVGMICAGSLLLIPYLYMCPGHMGGTPTPTISFIQTISDQGWEITITDMYTGNVSNPARFDYCLLKSKEDSEVLETSSLESIRGTPSPGYNIMWVDMDEDNMVSIGDKIAIPKSGGSLGAAQKGFVFVLLLVDTGGKVGEIVLE